MNKVDWLYIIFWGIWGPLLFLGIVFTVCFAIIGIVEGWQKLITKNKTLDKTLF